ncbi:MAG: class I SAM-dependent methyltransferase [Bacteroidetes bacterium]|nr:class I SAM-dependent methyltransferase [Bacteroidota bacterium]
MDLTQLFKPKYKRINDPFFKRLSSSVLGGNMLLDGNIFLMDHAIKNMPENSCVFEIGCFGGHSSVGLLHLIKKHKRSADLYACDCWVYEGFNDHTGKIEDHFDGYTSLKREDFMNYVKANYQEAVKLFHPEKLPYTVALTSDEFFNRINNKNECIDLFDRKVKLPAIGFAYIDGGHSYEQCKKDFINIDKHLINKGFVLFDDSSKKMKFGSALFIKEMMENPGYELIDQNPNFLFKKR